MNLAYFGTEGLTSTSANFIANKSKEIIDAINAEASGIDFINTVYTVVGKEPVTANKGKTKDWLDTVVSGIKRVGQLSALNAWLREAIKERDKALSDIKNLSMVKWAVDTGREKPDVEQIPFPTKKSPATDDEIIAEMAPEERQKFLMVEARAAALGKFIHKGGAFERSRNNLHAKSGRTEVSGTGDQLTIATSIPSVEIAYVDKVYLDMQEEYRKLQAELNGLKHVIEVRKTERDSKALEEYNTQMAEHTIKARERETFIRTMLSEFEAWKRQETEKILAYKIVIPESLQEIYKFVKG